jgi:hypothetical protein
MINKRGGMKKWWKNTGLDMIKELDERSKKEAYGEFLMFFNRLVILSAVKVVPDPYHSWEQIQGHNSRHMAAGHTASTSRSTSGRLNVNDLLNRPHDAYKVISFNKDQENLLSNDIPSVVFWNDFGAGNILRGMTLNQQLLISLNLKNYSRPFHLFLAISFQGNLLSAKKGPSKLPRRKKTSKIWD